MREKISTKLLQPKSRPDINLGQVQGHFKRVPSVDHLSETPPLTKTTESLLTSESVLSEFIFLKRKITGKKSDINFFFFDWRLLPQWGLEYPGYPQLRG